MKGNTHPAKAHPQGQTHPWRRPWPSREDVQASRTMLRRLARTTCADCESDPCRCRP